MASVGHCRFDPYTRSRLGDRYVKLGIAFLIIASIAGVLGFGVVTGNANWVARTLFVAFLVLFIIGTVMGRRGAVAWSK